MWNSTWSSGSAASARKISVDRLLSDVDGDSETSISSNRRSPAGQNPTNQRQNSITNNLKSTSRQPSVDELEVSSFSVLELVLVLMEFLKHFRRI